MFNKNTKKGQVMIVSVIIAVVVALTSAYILLHYLFKEKSPDEFLGSYQSAIINSMADGEKVQIYVDQAAKLAISKAFDEYTNGPPKIGNGGDSGNDNYCGSYVYRLWNTETKNCYPQYSNNIASASQSFELTTLLNKNLAQLTYLLPKDPDDKNPYLSSVLKQKINYNYKYSSNIDNTDIVGYTDDKYTIYIFKNKDVRNNEAIQAYVDKKIELSGGVGDIPGVPLIQSAPGNYQPANNRNIKYLVIHYTAGSNIAGAMSRFLTPGAEASAHYIVGSTSDNYVVKQAVLDKDVAYHAGCNRPDYGCQKEDYKLINSQSIGIEVVNLGFDCGTTKSCKDDADQIDCTNDYLINGIKKYGPACWQKYPPEQYDKVVALSAILIKKNPQILIDREHIIGHVEVVQKNKVDPGPEFNLDAFVDAVKAATALDETTLIGQIATADTASCLQGKDTDWSIEDVRLTSTNLKSDEALKVSMDIKNAGATCINIQPRIRLTPDDAMETANPVLKKFNVYKSTDTVPFSTFDVLSCTFTDDKTISKKARDENKCVLYVNPDGSVTNYVLSFVTAVDYYGDVHSYTKKELKFTVQKNPTAVNTPSVPLSSAIVPDSMSQLPENEQRKIQATITNLGADNIKFVDEMNIKYEIPKGILLALITQESTGVNYPINIPKNNATGVTQVEGRSHYDTINKICGADYISECGAYDKTANDYSTCKFEKFGSDTKCQIEVSAQILRKNFDTYNTNNDAYTKNVKASCKDPILQSKYLAYTGWERALRAYNGLGCKGTAPIYVDKIRMYASAWGYVSAYDGMTKEEMSQGIFGIHTIQPLFNTKINFDMTLFTNLTQFVSETVKTCGSDNINRTLCLEQQIAKFNNSLPKEYEKYNVHLSTDCDINKLGDADALKKTANTFIEEVNDCMNSADDNCQCVLTPSTEKMSTITSSEGQTVFQYASKDSSGTSYIDFSIKDATDQFWKVNKDVMINEIKIYKNITLRFGDLSIITNNHNLKKCSVSKSQYRLCLKTNYKYLAYDVTASDAKKIAEKNIIIPFAITIRDRVPPAPVTGISSSNMPHTKNSVILMWNKNNESDVVKYNIYMSDDKTVFNKMTKDFKASVPYNTVSSLPKGYKEYKTIDFKNPTCALRTFFAQSTMYTPYLSDYCVFEYRATDMNNNVINLTLEYNVTYYINSTKKFVYILNGTYKANGLINNQEKFIAITAIDMDENEIDNLHDEQKLTEGQNLLTIKPIDTLELGFVKITEAKVMDDNKTLSLVWNEIKNYIDGTEFTGDSPSNYVMLPTPSKTQYDVKLSKTNNCQNSPYPFSSLTIDKSTHTDANLYVDMTGQPEGNYCIGIQAKTDQTNGYEDVFLTGVILPKQR